MNAKTVPNSWTGSSEYTVAEMWTCPEDETLEVVWPLELMAIAVSRLDYCNSILACLVKGLLSQLQQVQNAAARLAVQPNVR